MLTWYYGKWIFPVKKQQISMPLPLPRPALPMEEANCESTYKFFPFSPACAYICSFSLELVVTSY